MSKRSLGDVNDDIGPSKRHKATTSIPSEKLALLQKHRKELKAFIKAAGDGDLLKDSPALELLIASNKSILPILQSLSSENSKTESDKSTSSTSMPASREAPETIDSLPDLQGMSVWKLEDIPSTGYPPLPPIPDQRLEQMALTHSGRNSYTNYETLEFLGDSFIYHVASEIITQTFPTLTPGRKSQIREALLRNSNLATYTQHYGIEKRAILPSEFYDIEIPGGTRVTVRERQKVYGDLFEAYVGALIRARPPPGQGPPEYDGVAVALRWLRMLWAVSLSKDISRKYGVRPNKQFVPPIAQQPLTALPMQSLIKTTAGSSASSTATPSTEDAARPEGTETTQAASSDKTEVTEAQVVVKPQRILPYKVQLSGLVCCKEIRLRYVDVSAKRVRRDKHTKMPMFTIAVWVDAWGTSECLGYGTALSKKDAGEKAASQALKNKSKIKYYVAKKATACADRMAASPAAVVEGDVSKDSTSKGE
ncbi:hypothetical protein SEPCBS57363_002779 [Sporothrix epigloea]|uniref:RNase III domain-containing protein n=1 Tax=Sporothrix epigloea TaxID=1892477 RepID=A0ABP0DHU3_9PEZI